MTPPPFWDARVYGRTTTVMHDIEYTPIAVSGNGRTRKHMN